MRRDIQLLRGLAVLLVVLYHSDTGVFAYGYLGVDVFFVVSGFLITSIILRQLDGNRFSFSAFYLRRAKRLLPALYCTLAITALFAYGFISGSQWNDFIAQLFGSVTFSSNMVLPTQVGYFESEAEGKPLLHIWSLSLEEQYYFLLPLVLFLTAKSWRIWMLVALVLGSAAWCLTWASNPEALPPFLWRYAEAKMGEWAFYLFPTRAWELLAGSLCAWLTINRRVNQIPGPVKVAALLVIILVSSAGVDSIHPRGDALIVVLATSLLVLGGSDWLPGFRLLRGIERIGDWSYSVYLVHWPLFAFAYLGYAGFIPTPVKLLLIGGALVLGYAQYRWVEVPFRYGWNSRSRATWNWFAVATLAVVIIPTPMVLGGSPGSRSDRVNYSEIRKTNFGLSRECDNWILDSGISKECVTGKNPRLAVWGDSYAMHLVPGILMENRDLIQITKSSCGPIVGLAPIHGRYTRDWAERCEEFNERVIQKIIRSDSITHVILSSTFAFYFKGTEGQFYSKGRVAERDNTRAMEALISTIEQLRAAGKVPILVSPPPRSGFNIGECLEREKTDLILFRKSCDVPVADYIEYENEVIQALRYVEKRTGVRIIWLDRLLCDRQKCRSEIEGTFVYRDSGHLSISGSRKLLGNLVLVE